MKKKIILTLTMVALLICTLAISAYAADCIDGIYYSLNGNSATVSTDNQKSCELETVVIPEKFNHNGTEYTVVAISTKAFYGNTKVKSVTVPATVTSVGDYAFQNCTSITTVTCKSTILGKYMFSNCPLVKDVTLENTVTISNHAFCNTTGDKQTQIAGLVLPDTVESIGMYAFARCQITEIVLPASLTVIGTNTFADCEKLEVAVVLGPTLYETVFVSCGALNKLVLTERINSGYKDSIKDVGTTLEVYYTGNDPDRIKTMFGNCWRIDNAVVQPYNAEGSYTGTTKIIYGCNLCTVAFDNIHTEPSDDGNCTTALVCSMCKEYTIREAKTHINNSRTFYTSYMEKGEHYVGCTNEGCTVGTTEELSPLFTCLGYSSAYYGNSGIALSFVANRKAISRYNELTGEAIGYGIFAVAQSNAEGKEIIDVNGVGAKGVASVEFSGREYDVLEMKITGFETEEHKNAQLALGAYVIENGKVTYLQATKPLEGNLYTYVSYNSLIA